MHTLGDGDGDAARAGLGGAREVVGGEWSPVEVRAVS